MIQEIITDNQSHDIISSDRSYHRTQLHIVVIDNSILGHYRLKVLE